MKAITLLQPQKIIFGTGCIQTLVEDYNKLGFGKLFVLTAPLLDVDGKERCTRLYCFWYASI